MQQKLKSLSKTQRIVAVIVMVVLAAAGGWLYRNNATSDMSQVAGQYQFERDRLDEQLTKIDQLVQDDKPEAAVAVAESALVTTEAPADRHALHAAKGYACRQARDLRCALKSYQVANEIESNMHTLVAEGDLAAQLGQTDQALQAYHRAQKLVDGDDAIGDTEASKVLKSKIAALQEGS